MFVSMSCVASCPKKKVWIGSNYPKLYQLFSGKKPHTKAPKIQRLVTPVVLQRKRHRLALKRQRSTKRREDAALYHKMMAQYAKVFHCNPDTLLHIDRMPNLIAQRLVARLIAPFFSCCIVFLSIPSNRLPTALRRRIASDMPPLAPLW